MGNRKDILAWLLDSDPSLLWQVQKDLLSLPPKIWEDTRKRLGREGFVSELLKHQERDSTWAHGAHFPCGYTFDEPGQPYTATGIVLSQLRELGAAPEMLMPNTSKLLEDLRWEYEDRPFWDGEVDVCINAYTLSNGTWLGRDMRHLIDWFEEHQLKDGGWNCEWVEGAVVSSFHSTLNALIALLDYEQRAGASLRVRSMRRLGEEYFLKRRLMYRLSTGERLPEWATWFGYPYRFAYSVIKALDYFRAASLFDRTPPDPRLKEAIAFLWAAQSADGTWLQQHRIPGKVWVEVDAPVGQPSKWLTFHALRVLDWWEKAEKDAEES